MTIDHLGVMLKQARKDKKMTLSEVAKETGYSISYIARIEAGQRKKFNYELFEKLKEIYGIKEPGKDVLKQIRNELNSVTSQLNNAKRVSEDLLKINAHTPEMSERVNNLRQEIDQAHSTLKHLIDTF